MNTIEKINAEMQRDPSDKVREIVGHYLIDRCSSPADAELIGRVPSRTLEGALKAVTDKARSMARNQMAVLTNEEVFGVVDEYFGLETDPQAQYYVCMGTEAPAAAPSRKLNLSIEEYI